MFRSVLFCVAPAMPEIYPWCPIPLLMETSTMLLCTSSAMPEIYPWCGIPPLMEIDKPATSDVTAFKMALNHSQQISSYACNWFVVGKYILIMYYYKEENVCVVNRDTPLGIFGFCSLDTEPTRAWKR